MVALCPDDGFSNCMYGRTTCQMQRVFFHAAAIEEEPVALSSSPPERLSLNHNIRRGRRSKPPRRPRPAGTASSTAASMAKTGLPVGAAMALQLHSSRQQPDAGGGDGDGRVELRRAAIAVNIDSGSDAGSSNGLLSAPSTPSARELDGMLTLKNGKLGEGSNAFNRTMSTRNMLHIRDTDGDADLAKAGGSIDKIFDHKNVVTHNSLLTTANSFLVASTDQEALMLQKERAKELKKRR